MPWIYKLVYTFCKGKLANLGFVKLSGSSLIVLGV